MLGKNRTNEAFWYLKVIELILEEQAEEVKSSEWDVTTPENPQHSAILAIFFKNHCILCKI